MYNHINIFGMSKNAIVKIINRANKKVAYAVGYERDKQTSASRLFGLVLVQQASM